MVRSCVVGSPARHLNSRHRARAAAVGCGPIIPGQPLTPSQEPYVREDEAFEASVVLPTWEKRKTALEAERLELHPRRERHPHHPRCRRHPVRCLQAAWPRCPGTHPGDPDRSRTRPALHRGMPELRGVRARGRRSRASRSRRDRPSRVRHLPSDPQRPLRTSSAAQLRSRPTRDHSTPRPVSVAISTPACVRVPCSAPTTRAPGLRSVTPHPPPQRNSSTPPLARPVATPTSQHLN